MKRISPVVKIGNVKIGGNFPPVLQSMTATDTRDVEKTSAEVLALHAAGAEIVRIAVPDFESARAVPKIFEKISQKNAVVPLVGDFHFNGAEILKKVPECARALSKFRINPGNTADAGFLEMLEIARKFEKPGRIGANAGSVAPEILKKSKNLVDAVIRTLEISVAAAESINFPADKIVLSAKLSNVLDTIAAHKILSEKFPHALHVGLTESGSGLGGEISSAVALGILLHEKIGDTVRVSITPRPGEARTREVEIGKQILQSLGIRNFFPKIVSCPGCGRTAGDFYQKMTAEISDRVAKNFPIWREKFSGSENLKISILGCVVNGPGEARDADFGICLPGRAENFALVFARGEKICDLRGENVIDEFWHLLERFVAENFKK